jgi:hypothetical protein
LAIESSRLSVALQAFVRIVGRPACGRCRALLLLGCEPILEVVTVLAAARLEVRECALADPAEPIGIVRAVLFRVLERLRVLIHVNCLRGWPKCKAIASEPRAEGDGRDDDGASRWRAGARE